MEQFSLEKYIENPNRKVVTRDGRSVRIVCTDSPDEVFPIVGFVENEITTRMWQATGEYNNIPDCVYDLFFADEEEELTEFETRIYNLINFSDADNCPSIKEVKEEAEILLDLARKEILKDLPKLEKTKDVIDPTIPVMYTNAASMKTYVEYHGYKLCINDVFEKLPKEE